MNDIEREAAQLLSGYVKEERPPHEVDVMIRIRLRSEARRRTTRRWIGAWAVAAAFVLVLWALGSAGLLLRTDRDASSAAQHAVGLPDTGGSVVKAAGPQSMQPSPPAPEPEPEATDDDPGVEALREARRLMRAGKFAAAFERLEPCGQTVGTDDLLEECEFISAQALCRSGDVTEGRQRAANFRSRWPNSSHARKLSNFCP